MQRISIENFGPVKKFEADVTDIMLLIGPQASGKSTISKSIFIFKSLKNEILTYIYVYVNALENLSLSLDNTINYIKSKFFTYFGIEPDRKGFSLKYQYSNEKYITISGSSRYNQEIKISSTLEKELNLLVIEISNYKIISKEQRKKSKSLEELRELESEKRLQFNHFKSIVYNIFEETHSPVFIPAGRSLMSTLAEQLQHINNPDTFNYFTKFLDTLDYFTKSFVERINLLRYNFTVDLNSLIQIEDIASDTGIDLSKLLKKILKGEYRFNFDGEQERIYELIFIIKL